MKDFSPEFTSIPDYIYKVTERIWEERGVDRINDYYHEKGIIRTAMGLSIGIEPTIAATNATLHQFPDRRLLGEDVIWSGSDDTPFYYSSHRIVSPMHHDGDGMFGAPTGNAIKARTIADTVLRADRVCEEWLVRDHGAIIRQIGQQPDEFAAKSIEKELAAGLQPQLFTPEIDVVGEYQTPEEKSEHAQMYASTLESIWRSNCTIIDHNYNEAVALELPGGFSVSGKLEATKFWMSLLSAIPDAKFSIDHLIGREDPGYPLRVAARWSITGTHAGAGMFGQATQAPIYILGISHAEIIENKIHREWILMDELAIYRQIYLKKG